MKNALEYVSDYQLKSACKDAICKAPSKVTEMIFAVLEDWYHRIVFTHSCKLVSFLHIYYEIQTPPENLCKQDFHMMIVYRYIRSLAICQNGAGQMMWRTGLVYWFQSASRWLETEQHGDSSRRHHWSSIFRNEEEPTPTTMRFHKIIV